MSDQKNHPPRCTDPAQGIALEAYLERTLSPEQQDAFEEHYFSCPACREELRLWQALPAALQSVGAARRSRRNWLAIGGLTAAAAAMLVANCYLGFVELPRMRERLADMTASLDQMKMGQQATPWSGPVSLVVLTGPLRSSGGDETPTIEVKPGQPAVPIGLTPVLSPEAKPQDRLLFQIREATGKQVWELGMTVSEVKRALGAGRVVTFLIPAGSLAAGDYNLVVYAGDDATAPLTWKDSFRVTKAE
jgi:hypothetical protein